MPQPLRSVWDQQLAAQRAVKKANAELVAVARVLLVHNRAPVDLAATFDEAEHKFADISR